MVSNCKLFGGKTIDPKGVYITSQTTKVVRVSKQILIKNEKKKHFNRISLNICSSNSTYAPYLPAEKQTTTPTENFVHLLDTKYSLEPLILAFKPPPSNDQSNLLAKKIRVSISNIGNRNMSNSLLKISMFSQEIVILSDDEDDSESNHFTKVKIEPIASTSSTILNTSIVSSSSSNMVDLTDEVYDETDVPRHYISWLADLVERAKAKAKTIDQRLQVASVSEDVIVIDDFEEVNNDKIEMPTEDEPQVENISHNNLVLVLIHISYTIENLFTTISFRCKRSLIISINHNIIIEISHLNISQKTNHFLYLYLE